MIYWLNTRADRSLLDRPVPIHVEIYLRENVGIDSQLLANDLGMSVLKVHRYQRQLGLRRFTRSSDYARL